MESVDLTKLLAGGGVGVVLAVMLVYFLRHLERRDTMDDKRAEAFLAVTRAAMEAIGRLDARAGVVLDAVGGIAARLDRIEARICRIETRPNPPVPVPVSDRPA